MAQVVPKAASAAAAVTSGQNKSSQAIVRTLSANEFVFGVVGPVGAGTSEIAEALKALMERRGFETTILKARHAIHEWASRQGRAGPEDGELIEAVWLQDLGDKMRATGDHAAVARALVREIRTERARQTKQQLIAELTAMLKSGTLKHTIARRFPLDEIAAAHEAVDSGTIMGNVVVDIATLNRPRVDR